MNSVALGFAIVFTLFTALLLFLYFANSGHSNNLKARGIITNAEVIRKFEKFTTGSVSSTSNPSDQSTLKSYFVEYEYTTETGELITEEENVGKEYQDYLEVGLTYSLIYDPKSPEISTLVGVDGYKRGVKILTILLSIFTALSVISWIAYFR